MNGQPPRDHHDRLQEFIRDEMRVEHQKLLEELRAENQLLKIHIKLLEKRLQLLDPAYAGAPGLHM